jgi:hypothetical protein
MINKNYPSSSKPVFTAVNTGTRREYRHAARDRENCVGLLISQRSQNHPSPREKSRTPVGVPRNHRSPWRFCLKFSTRVKLYPNVSRCYSILFYSILFYSMRNPHTACRLRTLAFLHHRQLSSWRIFMDPVQACIEHKCKGTVLRGIHFWYFARGRERTPRILIGQTTFEVQRASPMTGFCAPLSQSSEAPSPPPNWRLRRIPRKRAGDCRAAVGPHPPGCEAEKSRRLRRVAVCDSN